jgi:probable O-glycosylation ligase (exosortase A-associated)
MRDILLSLIVFGLLPFILRKPVLGAYTWAWLGMMNPHKSVYGFARTLPFAYMVALVTLVGLLFSRQRKPLPGGAITTVLMLLIFWMSVTSYFALNSSTIVLDRWIFVMKIQVMIFVTLMLIRGRERIDWLIWVVTFSVGFYGVKGGIWTVLTGGGGRVWGPSGGMIEGNNELAVALIMLLPLMYYLFQTASRRIVRIGLLISMVSTSFAVLGSQSRGALIGLCAIAFYLAVKSRYPVRMSVLLGVLLAAAIGFMPDSWTGRMDTIQSYQGDSSAMSRIYAWKTMWAAAVDRPLVGAGFAADNPIVYQRYAPRDATFEGFDGVVFVAHSIYLQMIGEHGFPGFVLFLLLGAVTWRTAGRLARQTHNDEEFGAWVPLLMPMVQVSLVGFAVGGAFLSLAYFDLPYYVVSFVVLVDATVKERDRARALEKPTPAATATAAPPRPLSSPVRESSS